MLFTRQERIQAADSYTYHNSTYVYSLHLYNNSVEQCYLHVRKEYRQLIPTHIIIRLTCIHFTFTIIQ